MEDCEATGVAYESFDLAFVDLHIKRTAWPIDKTIEYLKQRGVRRVVIASGSPDAAAVANNQKADGVTTEKIPEDLAEYLVTRQGRP
jgi:hypothetical protein